MTNPNTFKEQDSIANVEIGVQEDLQDKQVKENPDVILEENTAAPEDTDALKEDVGSTNRDLDPVLEAEEKPMKYDKEEPTLSNEVGMDEFEPEPKPLGEQEDDITGDPFGHSPMGNLVDARADHKNRPLNKLQDIEKELGFDDETVTKDFDESTGDKLDPVSVDQKAEEITNEIFPQEIKDKKISVGDQEVSQLDNMFGDVPEVVNMFKVVSNAPADLQQAKNVAGLGLGVAEGFLVAAKAILNGGIELINFPFVLNRAAGISNNEDNLIPKEMYFTDEDIKDIIPDMGGNYQKTVGNVVGLLLTARTLQQAAPLFFTGGTTALRAGAKELFKYETAARMLSDDHDNIIQAFVKDNPEFKNPVLDYMVNGSEDESELTRKFRNFAVDVVTGGLLDVGFAGASRAPQVLSAVVDGLTSTMKHMRNVKAFSKALDKVAPTNLSPDKGVLAKSDDVIKQDAANEEVYNTMLAKRKEELIGADGKINAFGVKTEKDVQKLVDAELSKKSDNLPKLFKKFEEGKASPKEIEELSTILGEDVSFFKTRKDGMALLNVEKAHVIENMQSNLFDQYKELLDKSIKNPKDVELSILRDHLWDQISNLERIGSSGLTEAATLMNYRSQLKTGKRKGAENSLFIRELFDSGGTQMEREAVDNMIIAQSVDQQKDIVIKAANSPEMGSIFRRLLYYMKGNLITPMSSLTALSSGMAMVTLEVGERMFKGGFSVLRGSNAADQNIKESVAFTHAYATEVVDTFRSFGKFLKDNTKIENLKGTTKKLFMGQDIAPGTVTKLGRSNKGLRAEDVGIGGPAGSFIDILFSPLNFSTNLIGRADDHIQDFVTKVHMKTDIYTHIDNSALYKDFSVADKSAKASEYLKDPKKFVKPIYENAMKKASEAKLTQELKGLPKAIGDNNTMEFIAPYFRTGYNEVKTNLSKLPIIGDIRHMKEINDLLINGTDAQKDKIMAKWGFYSSMGMGASYFGYNGLITGSGPSNPDARRNLGPDWQPFSIRFPGGKYVSYRNLTGAKTVLGVFADLGMMAKDAIENGQVREYESTVMSAIGFLVRHGKMDYWASSIGEIFDFVNNPDRTSVDQFDRFIGQQARKFIPAAGEVRQIAKMMDPVKRETMVSTVNAKNKGADEFNSSLNDLSVMFNQVKSGIPFWSESLPGMRDLRGDEIPWVPNTGYFFAPKGKDDRFYNIISDLQMKTPAPGFRMEKPKAVDGIQPDSGFTELKLTRLKRKVSVPGGGSKILTPEEYDAAQLLSAGRDATLDGKKISGNLVLENIVLENGSQVTIKDTFENFVVKLDQNDFPLAGVVRDENGKATRQYKRFIIKQIHDALKRAAVAKILKARPGIGKSLFEAKKATLQQKYGQELQ